MNKLPASAGWAWIKEGAGLFRKQPAGLTTVLFANILISITLSALPFIGPLLAIVLIPSFSVAFMQACLLIDSGQRVTPGVILTGFRKPAVIELCKLGLVYLGVSMLMAGLARLLIDPSFWEQFARPQPDPTQVRVQASDMLSMLAVFVLDLFVLMSLAFAAPLVFWQKMGPAKATFYSFFAVVKSARVFIVMLLAWFALFFGASFVVTLLLGSASFTRVVIMWLIFLFVLLLQCALYAGYRTIFGKPAAAA